MTAGLIGCGEPSTPPDNAKMPDKVDIDVGDPMPGPGSASGDKTGNPPDDGPPPLYNPIGSDTKDPDDTDPGAAIDAPAVLRGLINPETRDAAADALAAQGAKVVPDLTACLDDDNWQVRAHAAFALGVIGKDAAEALPALKKMAEGDEHESARDAAANAVAAISE